MSHRLPLPDDEIGALQKVHFFVTPFKLLLFNFMQYLNKAVTALIFPATSSDVVKLLHQFTFSGLDLLLELFIMKISVSGLLSVSSVSVLILVLSVGERKIDVEYIKRRR